LTSENGGNNQQYPLGVSLVIESRDKGLRPVLLGWNHKPVHDNWTPIYENPEYWIDEKNIVDSPKFYNIATTFGKTHLKDSQGYQHLAGLDSDSEGATKLLETPIDAITDPVVKGKLLNLYFRYGHPVTANTSLLAFLKQVTLVVKTRKQCGYLILWHSHIQHHSIRTEDCKPGYQFEIKTGKALATLPPSTHRDDSTRTFRYSFDCAQTKEKKIAVIDELHEIVIALLKVSLRSDSTSKLDGNGKAKDNHNSGNKNAPATPLHDLSEQMIQDNVISLTPYYTNGYRNNFALYFSGTTWHAGISEGSASKILLQIATNTHDEEIQSRLATLHGTYEKGYNGSDDTRIKGAPALAELISSIKGYELNTAQGIVASIQSLWRDDIKREQQKKKREQREARGFISVSEATRLTEEGAVAVTGKIVGMTPVEHMITRIHLQCTECSTPSPTPLDYTKKPKWKPPISDPTKSYFCGCEGDTAAITSFEYISSMQIKLQDLEKLENIGQLTAILFRQHTEGFQFNDIVNLKGNLYIMRNGNYSRNKLEGILFVESIEKQSKDEEVVNTEEDIQQFKQFALEHINNGSIIDELISRSAPLTIGNELAKKALLIVAINAGLPNDSNRLPERIRSHAGLIGDPGQAKTKLLKQFAPLVPGSRVESVQSGTPISMTVYVDKEENGQRMIRPGPLIFASDGILGLNEFGQMRNIEDGKYFTDAAEEGCFTVTKHGLNFPIIAHPSFVWTANPISGRWKNPSVIDEAEFPIIAQWGDRTDFIIPFIENTDPIWIKKYIQRRKELLKQLGSCDVISLWMKKYLMYARSLNPELPENMRTMLGDYLIEIVTKGVKGWPRKLEALERTAIGFAKFKLKEVVDEEDISDTIDLFNEILKFYKPGLVPLRDRTFLQCLPLLQKTPSERELDGLIREVCVKNPDIDLYIGKQKTYRSNRKIQALTPLFDKHPNIRKIKEKPITYVWVDKTDKIQSTNKNGDFQTKVNNFREQSSYACDVCYTCDSQRQNDDIKNIFSCDQVKVLSHTQHTQHTQNRSDGDIHLGISDNPSDESSETIDYDKHVEETPLIHSPEDIVLTNDDYKDDNDANDNTRSSNNGNTITEGA
jgi:DNA replicative helicase MCM subunit Mcm2 (Cdc46/Mcm family)